MELRPGRSLARDGFLRTSQRASYRNETRQPAQIPAAQAVREAMDQQRMKTGIQRDDFEPRSGGRIAVEYDIDIFPKLGE
jgi:hypothetical protein